MAKNKKKLRGKEPELVKALAQTTNVSEAGRIAGYGRAQSAHRAMKSIQAKIPELMDEIGLTDEFLLKECLKPGLSAMDRKFFADKGIVLTTENVIAWGPRRDFLDMAFKLKGSYAQQEVGLNHTYSFDFSNATEEQVDAILRLCAPFRRGLPESTGPEISAEPVSVAVR